MAYGTCMGLCGRMHTHHARLLYLCVLITFEPKQSLPSSATHSRCYEETAPHGRKGFVTRTGETGGGNFSQCHCSILCYTSITVDVVNA